MPYTHQITVNSTTPTPITVQSSQGCNYIRILENLGVSGWPTTDLLIYKGSPSLTPVRILAGKEYIEPTKGAFLYNTIPYWVKTVTGSTTLDVDEGPPI